MLGQQKALSACLLRAAWVHVGEEETGTNDIDANDLTIGLLDLLQLPVLCISDRKADC